MREAAFLPGSPVFGRILCLQVRVSPVTYTHVHKHTHASLMSSFVDTGERDKVALVCLLRVKTRAQVAGQVTWSKEG